MTDFPENNKSPRSPNHFNLEERRINKSGFV